MNTKNLDAIKRMVVRLQAIKETDSLHFSAQVNISNAIESLDAIVYSYEEQEEDDSVR